MFILCLSENGNFSFFVIYTLLIILHMAITQQIISV